MILVEHERAMNHFHVCCGRGGGARGFNRARARMAQLLVRGRCIGGVDNDRRSVRDFERLAGVAGTQLDLFTREQYVAFHGQEPPAGWREATPLDFVRAAGGHHPHVVFMSTPCKGFSGLLSERQSKGAKYQALNGLTLRAVWLTLEAWKDDPVELIFFENVPRIRTRGRWLLDQILALLHAYGYVAHETVHDCGEIGGLAQHRQRFLLVARYPAKVPAFMYEPPRRPVRGVGEVIGRLPMPLSGLGGPMHRIPSLKWKTWQRLAFVEAGSDWRSLKRLRVVDGFLADYALMPEPPNWHNGALGVTGWNEASGTVTAGGRPHQGAFSVADPCFDAHARSVQLGVRRFSDPAPAVTGQMWPGQGPFSVADPCLNRVAFNHVFRIVPWRDAAPAVSGPGGPAGLGVADIRIDSGRNDRLGVRGWTDTAHAVGGESLPSNGAHAVADPSPGSSWNGGKYRVTKPTEPSGAVIAESGTGNGAYAVADQLPAGRQDSRGGDGVLEWSEAAPTITGVRAPGQGNFSVADLRYERFGVHHGKLRVEEYDEAAHTITGSDRVGSGALSVADPMPAAFRDGRHVYLTAGHYGVVRYEDPSGAVTGSGQHDSGRWSVADPHVPVTLPDPEQNLIAVIRALDGTWHRPFTTLELAALQSLFDLDDYAEFKLDGDSDAVWREGIGNAVPGDAGEAMGNVAAEVLAAVWTGQQFRLSDTPIWVRQQAIALAVDVPELPA